MASFPSGGRVFLLVLIIIILHGGKLLHQQTQFSKFMFVKLTIICCDVYILPYNTQYHDEQEF